ncbi:hypothetical protein ACXYMU_01145 [Pontibacter sp. CAU 1760]
MNNQVCLLVLFPSTTIGMSSAQSKKAIQKLPSQTYAEKLQD